jgi:hypothetical protein
MLITCTYEPNERLQQLQVNGVPAADLLSKPASICRHNVVVQRRKQF